MVVKLYESDGVKVFNITADKVLPQWVQKKRGRKLSRDEGYARHIELLQVCKNYDTDCRLTFESLCSCRHGCWPTHVTTFAPTLDQT